MARSVDLVRKKAAQADVGKPQIRVRSAAPALSLKPLPALLLGLLGMVPYLGLLFVADLGAGVRSSILVNLAMSAVGFVLTVAMIPVAASYILRKDMFGFDINKKGSAAGAVKVPESLGVVPGVVFLTVTILFQPFFFTHDHTWLPEYNAALMSVCFMLFLGFLDDVLDIPWRVKLLLPSIAALPLLMAYTGGTAVLIPKPLQPLLGTGLLELGWLYKLYMGLITVFCTNSINILAGINGLEVGQTVVIACAVSFWSGVSFVLYLYDGFSNGVRVVRDHYIYKSFLPGGLQGKFADYCFDPRFYQPSLLTCLPKNYHVLILNVLKLGAKYGDFESQEDILVKEGHIFSVFLMQPFVSVALGLLAYNWYPSSVFVGDSFTYFAGMALAVVGCLGHFSETLLLFFLPQIVNFVYSVPQLFKIVPCPRHRLPKFDPETKLLKGSNDMNLVNLFLRVFGRCTEQALCVRLLVFQIICCGFCFLIRRVLEGWYK